MDEFKESVRKGFQACKADIQAISADTEELRSENQELKNTISELSNQISMLTQSIEIMKEEVAKPREVIKEIVKEVPVEVSTPEPVATEPIQTPVIPTPAPSPIEEKQNPYEALLAFKAKANKREMLKQKLVSMIGENGMNLSELKFMFVEHFKYCSKATFYNYLKELEIEKTIRIERENSKNFVYLNAIRREI